MSDSLKFRADAKALATSAAILAKLAPARGSIVCLEYLLMELSAEGLAMTATDLDSRAAVSIDAEEIEGSGAFLVNARAFADALKGMAKEKGARVEAVLNGETGKLELIAGRTRLALATLPAKDYPESKAWEPSECWEADAAAIADAKADGVELPADGLKALKAIAKACKGVAARCERLDSDDDDGCYRVAVGRWTFTTKLFPPCLFKSAPRSPYSFGWNGDARLEAETYLRNLRASLDLPLIGESRGSVIEHEGRAVGMTFGENWRDYNESREMPADWTPPEGVEIEPVQWCEGAQQCTVEGVEYTRMHDYAAWSQRHVAPAPGALLWDDGAYSLPMPAAQRLPVSAVTVDVDGVAMPLRCKFNGDRSLEIELTAEQVAELCGPVDPSTFVDIEPLAFHHGRVIARGDAAVRFDAMQEDFRRNARKALKNCRDSGDVNLTAFNLGIAWRDKVAPFLKTSAPAAAEPVEAIEAPAVGNVAPSSNVVPFPVPAIADGWHPCGSAVPALAPDPFDGYCDASDFVDAPQPVAEPPADALVQLLADYAPPGAPAVPASLEARLARVEEALGIVEQPKRSPAHAAAIRRAWRLRREMRERADLDRRALLQANGYNRLMREDVERLSERVQRAEAFGVERLEFVAEIDRLRGELRSNGAALAFNVDDRGRLQHCKSRIVRRAATLRRDIARTRAERDGLAANLQAMTRRAADDAATIDRLGGDAVRPRFILNAR